MSVELTAAERDQLQAWWDSDWPANGRDVLDTLAEVVAGIVEARVEACAAIVRAEQQAMEGYSDPAWSALDRVLSAIEEGDEA